MSRQRSFFLFALAGLLLALSPSFWRQSEIALAGDYGARSSDSAVKALTLAPGPYLFVDDYLIESAEAVTRRVNQPQRHLSGPVVNSGPDYQAGQPFLSVVRDPESGRFRMWYNAWRRPEEEAETYYGPGLAYLESDDGVNWEAPYRRLDLPLTVSAGVLDSGPNFTPLAERFKLAYAYVQTPGYRDPEDWFKTRIAFSADGITWRQYEAIDTLFPGYGNNVHYENWGDIIHSFYDPIRGRYGLTFRYVSPYAWTNLEGESKYEIIRRVGFTTSLDYKHWAEPRVLFAPDENDPGVTQFYGGPAGVQRRGDLLIGMLKVLRDDVTVSGAPEEAFGMGYTVLTWSRDGENWVRDRHTDPFFEPDPAIGAWDHAFAWIDSVVDVGDELYLYYGGYRWGHKYKPREDRQIGLVKLPKDRFVAREAGSEPGRIMTPLLFLDGDALRLNVDASQGWVEVRILDENNILAAACERISGVDALAQSLNCEPAVSTLSGLPVRLEFRLQNASLFAFYLESDAVAPTPTPPPTWDPNCAGLRQEGEAGALYGAFQARPDAAASGGAYVVVPKGNGNRPDEPDETQKVTFCILVSEQGRYRVRGWTLASDGGSNSFYIQVNDSKPRIWGVPISEGYVRVDAPGEYVLDLGVHTVSVYLREAGARLDALELVKVGESPTPTPTVRPTRTPSPTPNALLGFLPLIWFGDVGRHR
ncbi:MAG: hypothetical protein GXP42_14770 [Chloroflexi bacterium]|nr:hypothetical protein [Chloroflexota bacterium]